MTTTTPNPQIRGPGIQYVASSLSPTHTPPLDEPTFLKWYDTEHLPDIVSTSGMPNAFRAFHVDKTSPYGTRECPRPFFAFYPMPRLEFTQGDEFRTIRIQSEMLPGSGLVFDVAEFDVGYYGLVGRSGGGGEGGTRKVVFFVCLGVEVGEEEEVAGALDEHTHIVSKVENYIHSRRFKLQFAHSNAQPRALSTGDEAPAGLPTWLVMHSFAEEPAQDVRAIIRNETNNVLQNAKQIRIDAYRLQNVQGKGSFFDSDEDGTI